MNNNNEEKRPNYDELYNKINNGEVISVVSTEVHQLPNTPKGRGGRKTKADRQALQESSYTYDPYADLKALGNPNGVGIVLNRLSMKTAASEGDKAQRIENINYIKEQGWDLNKVEEIWEVGSAWKKGKWRPLIDELINRIKNNEIAYIVCYEIARLTRDPKVAKMIQQIAQTYNVPIRFVKSPNCHPEKTDSLNEILYVILVQEAFSSSQQTSDRTKRNHKFRAELGRKRVGSDPMGMKTVKVSSDGNYTNVDKDLLGAWSIYEPNFSARTDYPEELPSEADVVKFMFQSILDGVGYSKIPSMLEARNIPTFGAPEWHRLTVKRILTNPVYAGYSVHLGQIVKDANGNLVSHHRPLIDKDTYWKVQDLLKAKSKVNAPQNTYRLSPILKCGVCGSGMYGKAARKRHGEGLKSSRKIQAPIYLCSQYTSNSTKCKSNSILMSRLDDAFLDIICKIVDKNSKIVLPKKDSLEHISILDVEIAQINDSIKSYKELIEKSTNSIANEAFEDKINKLQDDLSKLVARKDFISDDTEDVAFTSEDIKNAWQSDPIKVQRMVKALFASITIDKTPDGENPLNQFQLAKLGWIVDLRRINIEFHNGFKINLAEEGI